MRLEHFLPKCCYISVWRETETVYGFRERKLRIDIFKKRNVKIKLLLFAQRCGFLCTPLSVLMPQIKISYMPTSFQHHNSVLPHSLLNMWLGQGNTSGNITNILTLSSKKAGSKNIKELRLTVFTHIYHNFKYEYNFYELNSKELLQPMFTGRPSPFLIFSFTKVASHF